MYAIVEIAGQQFKVSKDQKLYVHRLPQAEGEEVVFDKVLLIADNGNINIGAPAIEGAGVKAEILRHLKGDKIIVFKKKRRKGYRVKRGHRQLYSQILVKDILESGVKPSKKEAKKETPKTVTKKSSPVPKKEETKKVKAQATKSTTAGKTSVKKTAKGDDLKKIEGIGPKIAAILTEAGYGTFEALSKADPAKISEILVEKGGKRYAMHNPETWPQQAQLAAEGKWDELKELQDKLQGGRK